MKCLREPSSFYRTARVALVSSALLLGMHTVVLAADKKPAQDSSAKAGAKADTVLVTVDNAWVRPTVKGQTASGGYMTLTASQDLTLLGFSTSVAGETELHEMVMDGSVMRMRPIESLTLPAGQAVTLKPGAGGKHLMLMDLKRALKEGEALVLTLKLRTADGKNLTQEVKLPIKAGQMMQGMHQHQQQGQQHGMQHGMDAASAPHHGMHRSGY